MNNITIESSKIIELLIDKNLYVRDNKVISNCNMLTDLENTTNTSINFIRKSSYDLSLLKSSIVLVPIDFKDVSNEKSLIYTINPQLAIVYVVNSFFSDKVLNTISEKASIDKTAKLGKNINIGDNVVIGKNCIIGDNTYIYPNCVIYPNTVIGSNVIINAGAKIGQEGFGYIKDLDGKYIQFPHIGKVIIKDNVEIGSNSCIDKGALSDTVIGENTKIDNLCHISHNVKIGKNCLIVAKAEISGSTSIGDDVYIGPNVSIIDGISIGHNAVIGMGAIVRSDVNDRSTIVPFEAFEKRDYIKKLKVLNGE
ncbi:UDP-3-O-(3-hydroxymyristoyl)glucosamine N-acyltransferase [Francisella sp. LA112445]|uniref:UDP-3-O-(3-hydroxymyristoyl)glucosamine N-acyltransferase n=1 Tax=Francisella sp. LA112445 TaxID=1395624 RepID=UPI001788BE2A|nr:UDP-3-O-(3-hydroxymyristoyl)glucosamine N-acyltransferase [Francisella sp. LA112445]